MRRVPVDGEGTPSGAEPEPLPEASCDCPQLDPEDWHEVESDWSDIAFVQTKIPAVMGVPLRFGTVKERLYEEAAEAGATVPEDAMLLLGEGRVRRPVMLEVELEDEPSGRNVIMPGGVAFTRLVSAPWGEIKKAHVATVEAAASRYGRKPDAMWLWYLTCNVCSGDRDFETLFVAHYESAPRPAG